MIKWTKSFAAWKFTKTDKTLILYIYISWYWYLFKDIYEYIVLKQKLINKI